VAAVSVILNSYNQGDYLAEAIESVLEQTFEDFELIVVDNGSTDDSPRIIESYSDSRIRRHLHKENVAISRRFNEAVAAATGTYVSFLYSDDWYLPTKLGAQVALFGRLDSSYGVVYCPALGYNQLTGRKWQYPSMDFSGSVLEPMFRHNHRGPVNMVSPLTRRDCFLRHRFYEDLFAEGEAMFYRVALTHKFRYDPVPQVVLRDHGRNAGKALVRNFEMTMVCLERLQRDPAYPEEARETMRRFLARSNRDSGWSMMRVGDDVRWARGRFAEAVRLQHRQALHPRLLAGLGLSLVPRPIRAAVNRVGHLVRRDPRNAGLVADY
jgi:glycosyltransferase involved in cell wall biosynthesis